MISFVYNYRSLLVRKTVTVATVVSVALVAFVFASMQMVTNGIEAAMGRSGDPNVALILRKGAPTEQQSRVDRTTVHAVLASVDGLPARPDAPTSVEELVVMSGIEDPSTQRVSIVALRGMPLGGYAFHRATMVEGRAPAPGTKEIAVGRSLAAQNSSLRLGSTISPRAHQPCTIVGIFQAGGGLYDSELWTDVASLQAMSKRTDNFSSIRVRLSSPERLDALRATVEGNTALGLAVLRETEYFDKLGGGIARTLKALATIVGLFSYLAAAVGAMITMFSNVAGRTREIAALRAIGFQRGTILVSFLLEAVILTAAGGALGTVAAMATALIEVSTMIPSTAVLIVWRFEPTPLILASSTLLALLVGLVGGLLPALRAAKLPPAIALRRA